MLSGFVSEPLLLEVQLANEQAGLFPFVTIYDEAGASVAGFLLSDRGGGLYQVEWPLPTLGQFTARFLTYSDLALTVRTNDEPGIADIRIEDRAADNALIAGAVWDVQRAAHVASGSFGEGVIAAAGHAGLHSVIDGGAGVPNVPHNTNNNLISSRLRIFPSKALADAATMGAADAADGEILRLFFDNASYTAGNAAATVQILTNFVRTSS